jgi:hypothetical protein
MCRDNWEGSGLGGRSLPGNLLKTSARIIASTSASDERTQ